MCMCMCTACACWAVCVRICACVCACVCSVSEAVPQSDRCEIWSWLKDYVECLCGPAVSLKREREHRPQSSAAFQIYRSSVSVYIFALNSSWRCLPVNCSGLVEWPHVMWLPCLLFERASRLHQCHRPTRPGLWVTRRFSLTGLFWKNADLRSLERATGCTLNSSVLKLDSGNRTFLNT